MKTLAERLDEEERIADEQARLGKLVDEALRKGQRNVKDLLRARRGAPDPSLDRLILR